MNERAEFEATVRAMVREEIARHPFEARSLDPVEPAATPEAEAVPTGA